MLNPEQVGQLKAQLRSALRDPALAEELLDHYCCLVEDTLCGEPNWEEARRQAWQKLLRDNDLRTLERQVQQAQRQPVNWKRWGISGAALMIIIAFFSFNLSVRAAQRPTVVPVPAYYTESYDWQQEQQTLHIQTHRQPTTPVRAGGDGQVLEVYRQEDTYTVVVWHNADYQSIYRNLSEVYVHEKQRLKKASPIGHTHRHAVQYQVRKSGEFIDPTCLFSQSID